MELVNNMLLSAQFYLQGCTEATVGDTTNVSYSYSWSLKHSLVYQKQWEVKYKMKAKGWCNKTLDHVLEDVNHCCQALFQ